MFVKTLIVVDSRHKHIYYYIIILVYSVSSLSREEFPLLCKSGLSCSMPKLQVEDIYNFEESAKILARMIITGYMLGPQENYHRVV